MEQATRKTNYLPGLDGLRGIAILLVVFFHNFGFIDYSLFGWIGVDLFFVLSGYLITGVLVDSLHTQHFLRNFYARRFLRIFPLYYLCLVIFLVAFPLGGLFTGQVDFYVNHQGWFWAYLQNWLLIFHFPEGTSLLNHFWSLAVEEQFYLVWPFVVLVLRKPKPLISCLVIVLALLLIGRCAVWMAHFPGLNYTTLYTFTRIDGICIGALVNLLPRVYPRFLKDRLAVIVIIFALVNFVFYFLNSSGEFPYLAFVGYTTFAAMFGLLLHEIVTRDSRIINLFFDWNVFRFFGRISYGLYVFHWPVFVLLGPFLRELFGAPGRPESWSRLPASLTATAVAIGISLISFYGYEQKFLRLKRYFR